MEPLATVELLMGYRRRSALPLAVAFFRVWMLMIISGALVSVIGLGIDAGRTTL
jgi:hypothetical protein